MSKTALSESLGLRKDLAEKLSGQDGHTWLNALKKFLRKEDPWATLLQLSGDFVSVPAIEEVMLTEELLEKEFNIRPDFIGDNFRKLFLNKKLKAAPAGETAFHAMQKDSAFKPIFEELGAGAIIPLNWILWHIRQQIKGKKGVLLTNGWANFGFVEVEVEEGKTEVWVVVFDWGSGDGCWGVDARPLGDSRVWHCVPLFLSRKLS